MADVTKQIAKWNAKFDTARIKATLDAMRPDMAAHVAAVFPQMAEKDTEVKQTLDELGLPSIQYPFYMCFGRELFAMVRRSMSGESAAIAAQTLVDKWVARGLVQSALEAIRTQVYNISAPIAP